MEQDLRALLDFFKDVSQESNCNLTAFFTHFFEAFFKQENLKDSKEKVNHFVFKLRKKTGFFKFN